MASRAASRFSLLVVYLSYLTGLPAIEIPRRQVLAPRQLLQYQAYKDVQLFHYVVPEQVTLGVWQFQANRSHDCDEPLQVIVFLKHGSYPVVRMESVPEPPSFAAPRHLLHTLKLRPEDPKSVYLNVSSPLPGDWFAASFFMAANPHQQSQLLQCAVWLSSVATFAIDSSIVPVVSGFPLNQSLSRLQRYRFYASENTWSARIVLMGCEPCPVRLCLEHRVIPLSDGITACINCRTSDCNLEMPVAEDDWNYIQVEPYETDSVTFQIQVQMTNCPYDDMYQPRSDVAIISPGGEVFSSQQSSLICLPRLQLIRQKLPGNFAFRYSQITEQSLFTPIVNVSTNHPTLGIFRVMPIVDIGGTFTVKVDLPVFELSSSNIGMSLSACLQFNERPRFTFDGRCSSGFGVYLNTSKPENSHGELLVPFPEAGLWYFLMQPWCYLKQKKRFSTITPVACRVNSTTLILQLESGPCSLDQCGDYGRCYQYLSGGLVFSSCHCIAGRRGWHCTDDSEAHSYAQVLTAMLLLTVSNVFYLPVVVIAIYRRLWTETLVYVSAMVFSILYHACDFEVSPYCVMRLSVLQYCDVFACTLSIWLTMIARSHLPDSVRSILHMIGALGLALGVEYDRTGFWVFVLPCLAGTITASISFTLQCFIQRDCYPIKQMTWLQMTMGMALMCSGMFLMVFFEGSRNYEYVHSARHVCFALSALCLLPGRRPSKGRQDGINTCSYIRVEELSDISHPLECGVYQHLLTPTP